MKIRTFTLLLLAVGTLTMSAQPTALIKKTDTPISLDGVIDEAWAVTDSNAILLPFEGDAPLVPTLGEDGETYWKMLWDDDGVYVLMNVTDDVFFPNWADDPPGANSYEYDKPEIYFDVNYIKDDGLGTTDGGANGHWQFAPAITETNMDGTPFTVDDHSEGEVSILVTDPNWVAEFFIPWGYLTDKDGIGVDKTGEVGFDVTVIDREPGDDARKRAVWANNTGDESWANMDGVGIITFEGATSGTYIDNIELADATIDENNGTVQIVATITPTDATNQKLNWTIEDGGTGRATVDKDGVVKGILDGTVIVKGAATDGSYEEATCTVTISNQIFTRPEANIIRNPNFERVTGTFPDEWGGWYDGGAPAPEVVAGYLVMHPIALDNSWQYQFNQANLTAMPDINYTLSFVAMAAEQDTVLNFDFEDTSDNDYNRYGATTSEFSGDGRSDWNIPITTEHTRYSVDVVFDQMVETTVQKVSFFPGLISQDIYLDSVELISDDDLALIPDDYVAVEAITVTGADGATSVPNNGTLQMSADVYPAEATLTTVKWSVENGSGEATIDENGLLTPVADGTVMVKAAAMDDSYVVGELEVTVTFPDGIEKQEVNTLNVYPNPAVNELNVKLTQVNSTVTIYNSIGKKMDEVFVTGTEYRFNISDYAPGIYFVKTGELVAKFIK